MKATLRSGLLIPVAALLGCTLSTAPSPSNPAPTGNWSNWQIQAGTAITSPPATYPSFLGAIQIQGAQASGIFTTVLPPGTPTPSTTVEDYSGSFASAKGEVQMATFGYLFDYIQPPTPYTLVPVGVIGGCVYPLNYVGAECLTITSIPSVGVEIAPLTGSYSGSLTAAGSPGLSGTVTATLTQSTTPSPDGSFSLKGSIAFPASTGFGSQNVVGTISGEGIALYSPVVGLTLVVSSTASTNPAGTQITVSNLTFTGASSAVTYTGTLARQ